MSPIPGYLTVKEAAALTAVSEYHWRRMCNGWGRTAKLDGPIQIGRTWLIPEALVLAYKDSPARRGQAIKSRRKDKGQ